MFGGEPVEAAVEHRRQYLAQLGLYSLSAADKHEAGGGSSQPEAGQPGSQQTGRVPFERAVGAGPSQQRLADQKRNRDRIEHGKDRGPNRAAGGREHQQRNAASQRGCDRSAPQSCGKQRQLREIDEDQ